jgi:NADH:ubiquinone oxidoreductase subunit K
MSPFTTHETEVGLAVLIVLFRSKGVGPLARASTF